MRLSPEGLRKGSGFLGPLTWGNVALCERERKLM